MNLAKKLLDQHKQRIKFDYSGELPEWAITICKENLSSQLEPQVMQKIAEDEKKLLDMLFASKIAEIQAHIIYGEPLEQRMGKVKLAEKLDDLHKKLKSNFSA